jgi:uncharacterized membrane protein YsdA (DUF1294 family)
MGILEVVLLVINIVAFLLMGCDKYKAQKKLWRIPEKVLFSFAFMFGAPGIYLGMKAFRHKTQHRTFTVGVPLFLVLNLVCYYYIKTQIALIASSGFFDVVLW